MYKFTLIFVLFFAINIQNLQAQSDITEKKRQYTQQLQNIQRMIERGELTFEEAAKAYSQDRATAPYGGSLGWHKKGNLLPEYESAALQMNVGELKIIQSQLGMHLIYLEDRRKDEYLSSHIILILEDKSE